MTYKEAIPTKFIVASLSVLRLFNLMMHLNKFYAKEGETYEMEAKQNFFEKRSFLNV